MSVEGGLTVELVRGGDTVIRSTRPLGAARVLEGKPVAEALALVMSHASSPFCKISHCNMIRPFARREMGSWEIGST